MGAIAVVAVKFVNSDVALLTYALRSNQFSIKQCLGQMITSIIHEPQPHY
jgi:hypothetical protein